MPWAKPLEGFILGGGRSSRFGSEKALFVWKGFPLFRYSEKVLNPFCKRVRMSSGNPIFNSYGMGLVEDLWPSCGPLGGIYSCLRVSETEWNVFLPCDTPFVPPELIEELLLLRDGVDLVIPRLPDGKKEPLIGLYHKNLIPLIGSLILRKQLRMTDLLIVSRHRFLGVDDRFMKLYPKAFVNFNTPPTEWVD